MKKAMKMMMMTFMALTEGEDQEAHQEVEEVEDHQEEVEVEDHQEGDPQEIMVIPEEDQTEVNQEDSQEEVEEDHQEAHLEEYLKYYNLIHRLDNQEHSKLPLIISTLN